MSSHNWEKRYQQPHIARKTHDPSWLDRYSPYWEDVAPSPILDLGCGTGTETLYFLNKGFEVVSCDFSPSALDILKAKDSRAVTKRLDISQPLPFEDSRFGAIVASLSLHYFSREVTIQVIRELSRVLVPGGVLLCRVNSIKDVNYGAGQGIVLERNFYDYKGSHKRFFDAEDINFFFADWKLCDCGEVEIDRFGPVKRAWEFCARKEK
ncbi:MAG: class I SAM-dependent methyltransferase [Spirochaetales bacterium]|nr:class I SAM-dependent methyltransferase [Spirochaetales bacterium]